MRKPSPEIQGLARRLLAFEEVREGVSNSSESPRFDVAVQVIAELRQRLSGSRELLAFDLFYPGL